MSEIPTKVCVMNMDCYVVQGCVSKTHTIIMYFDVLTDPSNTAKWH